MYTLQVRFVGEPGVDTGGLSREFWFLLTKGIADHFCTGNHGNLVLQRNTQALQVIANMCTKFKIHCRTYYFQNNEFNIVGTYAGMSIIQGGPGFPYFLQALYKYLSTGDYLSIYVDDNDIPEAGARHIVSAVRNGFLVHHLYNQLNLLASRC